MCRHCERLVEDAQHKQVVHAFMAAAADGINRDMCERGLALLSPVVADDIDVRFDLSVKFWHHNHFADNIDIAKFIYRDILKAVE